MINPTKGCDDLVTNMESIMGVVGHGRCSTAEQTRHGVSIEVQRRFGWARRQPSRHPVAARAGPVRRPDGTRDSRREPAAAREYLRAAGLTGEFWSLD